MVRVFGLPVRVHVTPATVKHPDVPALVLCNGIGASLEVLAPVADAFDGSRAVIRFDVPGVGSSPAPPYPYSMAGLALLVGDLLAKLGHNRFDLLGYSWGGALAQQVALQFPRRCRRLILVSTSTGVMSVPGRPQALLKMVTPRRYRDAQYAARIAPELYGGSLRAAPDDAARLLGEHTRAGSTRGYLLQLGAMVGWTSVPWLALVRQRTLLLFGDDDPIIPAANGRVLSRLLPHGQLVVYAGGHLELLVRAADLVPEIDAFLSS